MSSLPRRAPKRKPKTDASHAEIVLIDIGDIRPAPENDKLYRPVDPNDPDIITLGESIRTIGLREPLVLSLDNFIISGHRRFVGCKIAGLTVVPCRYENVRHDTDPNRFLTLLREYNRQRVKGLDEQIREAVIDADPEECRAELIDYRREKSKVVHEQLALGACRKRKRITAAKLPLLNAVRQALDENNQYWPMTVRQIHYQLAQNLKPLRHASKPDSTYKNDKSSYRACIDICARGRLAGLLPWEAIDDETRPFISWNVYDDPGEYIATQIRDFLKDGYRNLQRSQPNHVELVVEKNTVAGLIEAVSAEFTIPQTSGRGFCSLPPRRKMLERFRKSGKEKLVVLLVSDFDADGECIAESFGRSMRDDFGIGKTQLVAIKVALKHEQVTLYGLPPNLIAKSETARSKAFIAKHGAFAWELEALPPKTLQDIVRKAIVSVLDMDLFEREQLAEQDDAVNRRAVRTTIQEALKGLRYDTTGGDE